MHISLNKHLLMITTLCVLASGVAWADEATTAPTTAPTTASATRPTTSPTSLPEATPEATPEQTPPNLPPAEPTMQSLRLAFEAGQHNDVLRETSKLLNQRNLDTEFDRTELMVLRATSSLRLRRFKNAQDDFESLAKLPAATPSQIQSRCEWQATAWLLDKSSPRGYVPKLGKRDPIEFLTDEGMKQALDAFYKDQSADMNKRIESAANQRQLNPVLGMLDDVSNLAMLEVAVTKGDAQSKALRDRVFQQAVMVMDNYILQSTRDVQAIEDRAEQLIERVRERKEGDKTIQERYFVRRGINSRDADQLRAIQRNCKEMAQVVVKQQSEQLDRMRLPIQGLHDDADRVLNTNYAGEVNSNGRRR
jgi:hypothetical protein